MCGYCKIINLDRVYSYIIDMLKEADLLDEDYKEICCYCDLLRKFGLEDLRNHLNNITYIESTDILFLNFNKQQSFFPVRIHNYSKWA